MHSEGEQAVDTADQDDRTESGEEQAAPDQFYGTRSLLQGFLYKLQSKLRMNADWYPEEDDRVRDAFGRLKGLAEQSILPLVQSDNESKFRTMAPFYNALEVAFGDPDKMATAQRYIQRLR